MLKKIALYGGAFDPPHISHIQLIRYLEHLDFIDQVWLLPCGDRTDKKLLLSKNTRFALMQKIFKQNSNIKVVNFQIQMSKKYGKMVHTYDLLKQLQLNFNNHTFYFVIGGDILQTLQTWGNGVELKKQTDFIIFNRKGNEIIQKNLPPKYFKCEYQLQQISSSFIKKILLDQSKSKQQKIQLIQKYLPEEALECLKDQKIL